MLLMNLNLYPQIVAAIMAITGIVMMAYADGFRGDSFVGVALAVGSASTSALYKVRKPSRLRVEPFIDCFYTDFKYICCHCCDLPVVSSPSRCCSRCSSAVPTLEKWLTFYPPWASSISSSSPVCPSSSTSPRWSTWAPCPRCPGDTCVDWQDFGSVRLYTHSEGLVPWFDPCFYINKAL